MILSDKSCMFISSLLVQLQSFFLLPSFHRAPEAIRLRAGFDDVRAVGDAVQQRLAQPRIRKHLRPLGKRQVGRHDQRGPFGAFRNHLEQKLRADLRQWHVTHFVQRDHVVAHPSRQHAPHSVVLPGFHQLVHQVRRGRETHSAFLAARRHAQPSRQMRLARAALADQHHWFGSRDVSAFGQFANLRRRNLWRPRELELLQRLHPRQLGLVQSVRDGVPVALFTLHR